MTKISKSFRLKSLNKPQYQDICRYIEFDNGFSYVSNGTLILKSRLDEVFDDITEDEKEILDGHKMLVNDFEYLKRRESILIKESGVIGNDGYTGLLFSMNFGSTIHEIYDSCMNGDIEKVEYTWMPLECTTITSDIVDDMNFNVDIISKKFCHAKNFWGNHEFILTNKKSK